MFPLGHCVLLISLLKYGTEEENSQQGKQWLGCGSSSLQQQILASGECRWFPVGGIIKPVPLLPLFLTDSVFSEV